MKRQYYVMAHYVVLSPCKWFLLKCLEPFASFFPPSLSLFYLQTFLVFAAAPFCVLSLGQFIV